MIVTHQRLRETVRRILYDPENSKTAKVARGEALTQRRKPRQPQPGWWKAPA